MSIDRISTSELLAAPARPDTPGVKSGRAAGAAPVVDAERAVRATADLERSLDVLNRALEAGRRDLHFSVDTATGKTVIRIVQQSTGEVVRQIPSEEALTLALRLHQGASLTSLGVDAWT